MAELNFPQSPYDGLEYQGYKWVSADNLWVNLKSGVTVDVTVNNTRQVDSDEPAKVTNVGDPYNVRLDFEIPKGEKGETGAPGTDGVAEVDSVNGKKGSVVLDSNDVNV